MGSAARTLEAALGFTLLLLVTTALISQSSTGQNWSGDVELFHVYSGALITGTLTETEFLNFPYPALSLVPMAAPHLLTPNRPAPLPIYALLFAIEMSAIGATIPIIGGRIAAIVHGPSFGRGTSVLVAIGLLLLTPLVAFRFDVVPAMAAGLGILALVAGSPVLAGIGIGLATGLKIYAGVLVGIVFMWFWAGRQKNEAIRFSLGLLAAVAIALAPYLELAQSPFGPLSFAAARPLQLESTAAGLISLIAPPDLRGVVALDFGSSNLHGWLPDLGARVSSVVQLFATASVILVAAYRFRRDVTRGNRTLLPLVTAVTLGLLVVLVTGKVLSPQYLIWLLPFLPIVVIGSKLMKRMVLAAFALTLLVFPIGYPGLLAQHPLFVLLLNARNLMLWALAAHLLWALLRPGAFRLGRNTSSAEMIAAGGRGDIATGIPHG